MAIKELQTRISLKYDSYAAWTDESVAGKGANLVLLPGEIGICEIPSANAASHVAPTVLFKVGGAKNEDGSLKAFKDLPWASAKAADVYGWAKASDVVLEGKTIKFVGTDKTVVLNYVTESEVKAITDPIAADVANLKSALGATGSTGKEIVDIKGRLDVIEGEAAGSIKKAVADAEVTLKAYADQAEADALSEAKKYADAEVLKDRGRLDTLEAADEAQDALIAANKAAVEKEVTDRGNAISGLRSDLEAADLAINNKIGAVTEGSTVVGMISAAESAAKTHAENQVKALEEGQVALNKAAHEHNASEISRVEGLVTAEAKKAREEEGKLDARLDKVEAFFEGAYTEDGQPVKEALDTLVEIQNYITGEGEAASDLLDSIAANAEAIEALQGIVEDGGTLEVRVDGLESDLAQEKAKVVTLKSITGGYTGANAIKTAVEAAQAQADLGVENAGKAQAAADQAQREIDALELVVGNETTGLAAAHTNIGTNAAAISALDTRVTTAEGTLATVNGIVTGANSNDNLRQAITDLQTLTGDSAKGNEALHTELTRVAGLVDNTTTGLAATKVVADRADAKSIANAGRLDTIEADYLKAADGYIFNCGSSTDVVHTA